MLDGLVLGWRTVLLAVAGLHLLVGAALLLRRPYEVLPNRLLAVLLVVTVGHFMPQIIGFAGFYDRWPQLTFTPFAIDLILAPLVWAYAWSLTRGGLPPGGHWLWLPGLAELGYGLIMMVQPLARKLAWNDAVHGPWLLPVEVWGSFILLCMALLASGRLYLRYRTWLNDHTSAAADFDPRWLGGFLAGLTALAVLILVSEGLNLLIGPLSYAQQFPYFIMAGLIFYGLALGALLWHREAFPKMGEPETAEPDATRTEAGGKDWAGLARDLEARITDDGWHLDTRLTITDVARRLGTNETYVSRMVNQGAGMNFNRFVNRLRVAAVKAALARGEADILGIALDAGFNSKATFNRVFRDITGETPAAFRARNRN